MKDTLQYLEKVISVRPWIPPHVCERAFQMAAEGKITIEHIDQALEKLEQNYFQVYDRMKNKIHYYNCEPSVVPVGKASTIRISCKYNYQEISGDHEVLITPVYHYNYQTGKQYTDEPLFICAEENKLQFPVRFDLEQQYRITIWKLDNERNRHLFLEMQVYALDQDLYQKVYLKGDLHCHTTYSDGYEPPEQVACSARKSGCDFLAITDHNAYDGAIAAEQWVKKVNGNITIIPGEEYSSTYTPLHILSLGASQKLDPRFYSAQTYLDTNGCIHPVEEIQDILDENHSIHSDPLTYACTQYLFDRIRDNGGVSVLCHPLWKPLGYNGKRTDAPLALVTDLLRHRRFDGIEIVSGSQLNETHVSNLQHAIALDSANAEDVAFVGITDSHYYSTDPIAGKHFTVVFAEAKTAPAIVDAIKQRYCVAVEIDGNGKCSCYGRLRYVAFTYFLLREVFPSHDQAAYFDGLRMEQYLLQKSREN